MKLKMIGRKPKIYKFVFEEMRKNEVTGTFYQFPYKTVYMTLDKPICDNNSDGSQQGFCPTICLGKPTIAHTMDDNDIYSRCVACGDYAYYGQNHLDIDSEYFKWAITGKANEALHKELYTSEEIKESLEVE